MTLPSPSPILAVTVNGEPREVASGFTVEQMVRSAGIDPARVAIERNREIVPRGTLGQVQVEDGDAYEIVHFVGGG